MRPFLLATVTWLVFAVVATAAEELAVGPRLQRVSVNVLCPSQYGTSDKVEGSGTIILREVDGKPAAWILTADHVVADLREVKTVIAPDGTEKKQVRYRDAQIVQEQVEHGRGVGEVKFDAKVISVDPARDIALLRVRKGDFAKDGIAFLLDAQIAQPGTRIFHCGAPGGKEIGGTCSLTPGIVSRIGVRIPEFGGGAEHGVFDQVTCAALPGSSGGLVALTENGRYIGMITLGLQGSDSFHWMVPIRSVRAWAKAVGAEWLLDPNAQKPSEDQIKQIPLELNTPGFVRTGAGNKPTPAAGREQLVRQPGEND